MIDWLLHDEQHNLFEILVALGLNLVVLLVAALMLWPLGQLGLAATLGRGYLLLWPTVLLVSLLLSLVHRAFRINLYDHGSVYIFSNLAVSCLLQIGWAAFAAAAIAPAAAGLSLVSVALLYVAGLLSCIATFYVVSAWYQGSIYRLFSLPVALVAYILFAFWPAPGQALARWVAGGF